MTYTELMQGLEWNGEVRGAARSAAAPRIVVGGMGGSALPANAARFLEAALPLSAHRDYGLPEDADEDALYVAVSHSGNTAETLSFADEALKKGYRLAAVTSGGKLAELARERSLPHVLVPGGMQPRNALFYQLHGLLALIGRDDLANALRSAAFDDALLERDAAALARELAGGLPLFYASRRNGFLAWAAKIHLNESGKTPAYANVFPELNHNEMEGFDRAAPEAAASLARLVLLRDRGDDPRIARRMDVFSDLMRERGRRVLDVAVEGGSRAAALARGWFLAHRAAVLLAEARGADPEAVDLVEDFKRRL